MKTNQNPFEKKLQRAEQKLAKLEADQALFEATTIPGTYVTGRSGVSKSYAAKLNRQLDKTIDFAVKIQAARRKVRTLRLSVKLFDEGKINRQGRSICKKKATAKRPRSELQKILAEADRELSFGAYHLAIADCTLETMAQWNEKEQELEGFILVTHLPTGETTLHKANSVQGVHLEAKHREVITDLYKRCQEAQCTSR